MLNNLRIPSKKISTMDIEKKTVFEKKNPSSPRILGKSISRCPLKTFQITQKIVCFLPEKESVFPYQQACAGKKGNSMLSSKDVRVMGLGTDV